MKLKNKIIAYLANQYLNRKGPSGRITKILLDVWPEDVSEIVVMPASSFYVDAMVNHFKGKRKGKIWYVPKLDFSIVPSGIGAPSTAIVMEALRRTNAKVVRRVDVAGSLSNELGPGTFFLPISAIKGDCTSKAYFNSPEAKPSEKLVRITKSVFQKKGIPLFAGKIYSHDVLFLESIELINHVTAQGATAIDMETSTVYTLGNLFGIETVAVLFISNYATEGFEKEMSKIEPAFFEAMDKSFDIIESLILAIRNSKE